MGQNVIYFVLTKKNHPTPKPTTLGNPPRAEMISWNVWWRIWWNK